ncbi:hypothetical protein G9A89_003642 [Geosiphon pyriformis]|nr:hypothetical protein G9A89_003642 [Geosiphon pyriformis]
MSEEKKPKMPIGLNFRTAITDFLCEMQKVPGTKGIFRDCIFKAGFLATKHATNFEFISEPSFMVCDCGRGSVDLTTRKLLAENKLGEITERTGYLCGSTYVDTEFYSISWTMVWHKSNETLKQYINTNVKKQMEEDEWMVELQFEDIKAMFDPVVDKIIRLIRNQINANREDKCGGFMFLINCDEIHWGLDKPLVKSRVLKYTYEIQISTVWKEGVDPNKHKTPEGCILKFDRLVARRVTAPVDILLELIKNILTLNILYSKKNGYYCDDPDMKLVGEMTISLPNVHLGLNRAVEFGLTFNKEEITVTTWDKENDDIIPTFFNYVNEF